MKLSGERERKEVNKSEILIPCYFYFNVHSVPRAQDPLLNSLFTTRGGLGREPMISDSTLSQYPRFVACPSSEDQHINLVKENYSDMDT